MKQIELLSYDFCPFIQPIAITLLEKGVPFKMTYLEQDNKPDWFEELVPSGQTPALYVDGKVLLESSIINEYLDEVTPDSLHPEDCHLKAENRVWIEYSYKLLDTLYDVKVAETKQALSQAKETLIEQLHKLELQVKQNRYFNGDSFSLVDTAYAPVFRTINLFDNSYGTDILAQTSGLKNWVDNLMNRESVINSVLDNYDQIMKSRIEGTNSALL